MVNLAHAATGTYVAFASFEFRETGDLVLPVVGLPHRLPLVPTPTLLAQLVFTVVLGAALGVLLHAAVFGPLRRSPALSRVAASLGLLLYFQEVVRLRFPPGSAGTTTRRPVLPEHRVELLGTAVTANRLWLAAGCLAVAGGLALALRATRWGLALRAVAEDERGAVLVGLSPWRTGAASWALATVLAGLAVVLVEPIAGLDPSRTSLLVVPALAAALAGGLRSVVAAAGAGLAVGAVQSVVLAAAVRPGSWIPSWLPPTGLQQAVPVVVILVVLAVRGQALPGRGVREERRLPATPTPRWVLPGIGALVVGSTAVLLAGDASLRQGLIVSLLALLVTLSVVLLTGYVGQISLLPLALAGLAAFAAIGLDEAGAPFPLAVVLAAGGAAAVGALLALPALRIRGTALAVATLAAAVAVEQLVLASDAVGGGPGGRSAPRPWIGPFDVGVTARGAANFRPAFGITVLVAAAAAVVAVAAARRSPVGLRWLAVRSGERAAAASGVDVARTKLVAVAAASALAGLGGALTAYSTTTVSAASFTVIGAVVALALTTLGGVGRLGGAVLAAALTPSGLASALGGGPGTQGARTIDALTGLALVAAVVLAPDGILAAAAAAVRRLRSALR